MYSDLPSCAKLHTGRRHAGPSSCQSSGKLSGHVRSQHQDFTTCKADKKVEDILGDDCPGIARLSGADGHRPDPSNPEPRKQMMQGIAGHEVREAKRHALGVSEVVYAGDLSPALCDLVRVKPEHSVRRQERSERSRFWRDLQKHEVNACKTKRASLARLRKRGYPVVGNMISLQETSGE